MATQFLDLLWGPFILTGVEHCRIVPHFTASNDLDLYELLWALLPPVAAITFFVPTPPSPTVIALTGLLTYAMYAVIPWQAERRNHKAES